MKKIFTNIYTSGMDTTFAAEVRQKVVVINLIFTVTILYMIIFNVVALRHYSDPFFIIQAILAVLLTVTFVLLRRTKNHLFASYVYIILMGFFFIYLFASGGVSNTGHLWSYPFPLFAMFLLGSAQGALFTSAYLLLIGLVLVLPFPFAVSDYSFSFILRFLASYGVLFLNSYIYERVKEKNYANLKLKNIELAKTNIDLEHTKKNLTEQRTLTEEVFSGVHEGIGIINQNQTIVLCNPAFADILGLEINKLVGKNILTLFDKQAQSMIRPQFGKKNMRQSTVYELEFESRMKEKKVIKVSSSPRLFADHEFAGFFMVISDITEKKKVLDQLSKSEEKYKDLVEKAGIAILIDDEFGNFKYYNKKFLELFGYSKEEMKQQAIHTLVHPDDRHAVMQYHKKRLKGKNVPSRYEFRGLRKDDTVVYLEVDAITLESNGKKIGTRSYIWNVSESKRASRLQNALFQIIEKANSDIGMDVLFQSIHDHVGEIIDARNFYISIYDKNEDLITFPYFVDEVDTDDSPYAPGKGLTEYVLKTGRALLIDEKENQKLIEEGKLEMVGPPSKIWLGVPLQSKEETFGVMVVQSYTDENAYTEDDKRMLMIVSEQIANAINRKKTETALKESEERYRDLVEKAKIAVIMDDRDGNVIYYNKRFADMMGYSMEEMKSQSIYSLTHPDDLEEVLEIHKNRIHGRKSPSRYESKGIKKDGSTIFLEIEVVVIKQKGEIVATQSYIWDVTARKLAEKKLKEYQQHLEKLVFGRTTKRDKSNKMMQEKKVQHKRTKKD